jgi:hypothetical protein
MSVGKDFRKPIGTDQALSIEPVDKSIDNTNKAVTSLLSPW